MNSICNLSKNFMLLLRKPENSNDLYKCFLQYIKSGRIVLFLTVSSENLIKSIDSKNFTKEELKRLVVMELIDMEAFIEKLLELHDWAWLPALVVVDLSSVISNLNVPRQKLNNAEAVHKPVAFFQQLALCVASLFGYYESITKRNSKSLPSKMNSPGFIDNNIYSVLILNEHPEHFDSKQLELLVNLYYYKDNAFDNVQEVLDEITLKT